MWRMIVRRRRANWRRGLAENSALENGATVRRHAVRAWKALVGTVGDKDGVRLLAAWAKARRCEPE
jgi:hypothetical protein